MSPARRLRWWLQEAVSATRDRSLRPLASSKSGLVVVSPHLDDAVFSCSALLESNPGATVITVCTAAPAGHPLTDWDRACGFREGMPVMPVRKREDVSALALYGARAWWLEIVEGQYQPLEVDRVAEAIGQALEELKPSVVAVPLGIGHHDHVAVARACWELSKTRPSLSWIVYAEHPYFVQWPKLLDERLATLATCADLGPMEVDRPDARRKRAAIERYRTQVRALRQTVAAALAEERHWQFTPHPVALP